MNRKGQIIFLLVFVVSSLLLDSGFSMEFPKMGSVIRALIGGVLGIVLINVLQKKEGEN
ncbi:hypothetical protein H8K90_02330 [Winogradskyella echinorum]|uniref:XapX domain-containing protein n=1 Tax=Winogradskyella echinorum TaxID=538189 RepID=A0ABR6XXK4_9FLAO|nr:hypothetical protein [Winogradskyella echinorum]MBC3845205.1 hypothetical protein [Winogradskyella echinorum]MBC5749553.1 hypothetical protein [Winogradskyella echinorum]